MDTSTTHAPEHSGKSGVQQLLTCCRLQECPLLSRVASWTRAVRPLVYTEPNREQPCSCCLSLLTNPALAGPYTAGMPGCPLCQMPLNTYQPLLPAGQPTQWHASLLYPSPRLKFPIASSKHNRGWQVAQMDPDRVADRSGQGRHSNRARQAVCLCSNRPAHASLCGDERLFNCRHCAQWLMPGLCRGKRVNA